MDLVVNKNESKYNNQLEAICKGYKIINYQSGLELDRSSGGISILFEKERASGYSWHWTSKDLINC